ncbi:efflux transporter outer membrane subunit [Caulobacter sp. KR2-114]|uniref:efflux transporter outer membrane subunit n=1 Tax=Caulobacter sp. KR2-114 TaxID=3400912 RepID=UPI003C09F270
MIRNPGARPDRIIPRVVLAGAMFAALSAHAAVGPDFRRPAPPESQHYDEQAERPPAAPDASQPQRIRLAAAAPGAWWSALRSPKLDAVMRQAIDGSPGLAGAEATLAQANEGVASARGQLLPQLDVAGQAGRQRAAGGAATTSNVYAVGPQVRFDFDLFGGAKRLVEEKGALAELQRRRLQAAYLALTGDVATQALQLASARAQIDAVRALLADDQKTLDLVRTGRRYGDATEVDVAAAATQLAQDQTLLAPLEQQRDQARHALSVLAGKGPADWTAPDFDLDDFTLPADLPVSLPSELARQRPDILEAEAQLHAASAAVGVATADLYPRLQLSASLVDAGPGVGALWGVLAGLAGPIYHGGSLKAERRAAVDGYAAALAAYRQTVVEALGQVADGLQAIRHDGEEAAAQAGAVRAAEASLALNRRGYQAGEVDSLHVIDAERAYQHAVLGRIRAHAAQYLDTVQLSVALGGGEAVTRAMGCSGERSASPVPSAPSKTALFSKD